MSSERLVISRNEWADLTEAVQAAIEFPYCGACKAPVKIAQHQGRVLLLCIRRPWAHNGVGRSW